MQRSVPVRKEGIQPDKFSANAAASAAARGRRWEVSLAVFANFTGLTPDVVSYGAAVTACEAGGKWQSAVQLLLEALGQVEVSDIVFNAAISACEKGSRWQWAVYLLSEIEVQGVQ
ncbi:EMB2076, partial [Symbiodinium sp. KB8]